MSQENETQNTRTRESPGSVGETREFVAMLERYQRGDIDSERYLQHPLTRGVYGQRQDGGRSSIAHQFGGNNSAGAVHLRPTKATGIGVLFEHPEWQKPLFAELARRGIRFSKIDLKAGALFSGDLAEDLVYFNQASPSAYVRGVPGAVPFARALIRHLESRGVRVLNGSAAFDLELSKSAQVDLLEELGLHHPRSIVFNDVAALDGRLSNWAFPALLKPDQGGSGARMVLVQSFDEIRWTFERDPSLWSPDHLFLLQEYFPRDETRGIVRMEFVGGTFLYAMRVIAHGGFNLCPSEVCHPEDGNDSGCVVPESAAVNRVDFVAYRDIPPEAVREGEMIAAAGKLDVGGVEYLEALDGRRIFFDINANSNLRSPVARAFGNIDPFARVVDHLVAQLNRNSD